MAEEARIKIRIDGEEARKGVQRVGQDLEGAGRKASTTGGTITKGIIGANVLLSIVNKVAATVEDITGGAFGAGADIFGDFFKQGARSIIGTPDRDDFQIAQKGRQRAFERVAALVGRGGEFSQQDLQSLIKAFEPIERQGAFNIELAKQAKEQLAVEDTNRRIFEGLEKLGTNIEKAISSLTGGGRK